MARETSCVSGLISILPEELIIKVLSSLAVSDLVSCRRVNHHLNGIIDSSQRLQHHIDTAVAGVVDNPNSSLSLMERRDALARRQEAWANFQPQHMVVSEAHAWEEPVFTDLDGTWLHVEPLREDCYHTVEDVAVCPDNDALVAIGMRCGDAPLHDVHLDTCSFEVDILTFAGAAGGRHWTRESTIHVKDVLQEDLVAWEMRIEIHTDLLAVHLTPQFAGGRWPDRELRVFNWKTGAEISCLKSQGITAFRFLSNSVVLVGSVSRSESTATLELFSLPITNGTLCPTSMIKVPVATLGLPFVDNGCRISRLDFNPLVVKDLVIRGNCLFYNTSIDAAPFISPKSDNIMSVLLNVGSGYGFDNISFVVHSSTLLRHIPASYGNEPQLVPWEFWGPTATRWYRGGFLSICGHRCLLQLQGPCELRDFNPYRVRYLEKRSAVENDTSCLTVETEPSYAKCPGIKKGIYSSLPFVKLVSKKWNYSVTELYEDKVIGKRTLESGRYLTEKLYFG